MLKFVILVSIFFNYAYAGLAPRRSGLTNEEIFENLRETDIIIAEPKTFELDLDFDIEEVMRSVKKKLTDFFLSFSNQDSKCINRQCLHTKAKPMNGNILFCCCTGNLCNAKFEWVPEEHKDVIPAKDHPDFPTEKKSGQSSVMIIVLICFVVAFVALVVAFFVYKFKQQKDVVAIPTEDPDGLGKSGDMELITNLKLQDTQIGNVQL